MENRHLLSTSQTFDNERDQNWNLMHTEQPYAHMGMFYSAENGPLCCPVESMTVDNLHTSTNWNSASRVNGYGSLNQDVGASNYASDSSGPSQSPFSQTLDAESFCMVTNNYVSHSASSDHDGQSFHFVDGHFIDLMMGNGGVPHKRKKPGIQTVCERGSTNKHSIAGSSSNQPIPFGLHPEKHNMNYQSMPSYRVNSDPNYRGKSISIRGEASIGNVRSRSAINSEPIPGSLPLLNTPSRSSLSLSHHGNYASSVDLPWSSESITQVLDHTSFNSSHGKTDFSANQFLISGGATALVEVGGYHQDFVPNINLLAPQNFNSASMQSVTGACSSYSQRASTNFRASSSRLCLGHVAPSDEGLQLTGSYPVRDPGLSTAMRWHSTDRNGRSRILWSESNGIVFHDRLNRERHMIVNRSALYGTRSSFDQHRDMRLDVDHMSYEELLTLGERIGSVNTGLAENMISKCLTESIYCSSDEMQDEETCVICLEEYQNMDDVGTLKSCGHDYHVSCIKKWLSMKNLCPICKGSALSDDQKPK